MVFFSIFYKNCKRNEEAICQLRFFFIFQNPSSQFFLNPIRRSTITSSHHITSSPTTHTSHASHSSTTASASSSWPHSASNVLRNSWLIGPLWHNFDRSAFENRTVEADGGFDGLFVSEFDVGVAFRVTCEFIAEDGDTI